MQVRALGISFRFRDPETALNLARDYVGRIQIRNGKVRFLSRVKYPFEEI
jgi:stringent starvation protein B